MRPLFTSPLLYLFCTFAMNTLALSGERIPAKTFLENELEILVETIQSDSLTPDAKQALTEKQIRQHLALGHMTAQSLGPEATRFNLMEFADFAREFEQHLIHYYLNRIADFEGDGIDILDSVKDPKTGYVVVTTLGRTRNAARNLGTRAQVNYTLRETDSAWQIISIQIDDVDITQNFRSQFSSVLQQKSAQQVIKQIRKSNQRKSKDNPFK
ncbi:MlaC/ttg2D family ABC transporter substrate-binding protein [Pelagicoccus mobilis]|uniref:ABC transporter substrate-binding protein n=1 Tax=Pelagicoccus mobilis TaxID=415221 RepID=A0A934VRH0_9BACT|nr:ABC transporter substrate-binding protein [Pelagicoccus mobilis]MBK1877613.1 ABC transporter substrate-binding protein [Pelagicoccus mobilis]